MFKSILAKFGGFVGGGHDHHHPDGDGKRLNPNTLLRTIIVVAVCITIIVLVSVLFVNKGTNVQTRVTDFGLKNIGSLITQEGYYTNVQVISDKQELFGITIPFTTSKYIYSYSGKATAGLDFSKIEVSVDEGDKTVSVSLPDVELFEIIIDNDSLQVYDERQSIFTPLSISDVNDAQSALKDEVESTAIEQGILSSAKANAETLITSILSSTIDLTQYNIIFTEATPE